MTYEYFQPEYVKKFQCNGQICPNNCCKKNWNIDIDEKTFEKYSKIKPKSAADEITRHIVKRGGAKR